MKNLLRKMELIIAVKSCQQELQLYSDAERRDFWIRRIFRLREQIKRVDEKNYKGRN